MKNWRAKDDTRMHLYSICWGKYSMVELQGVAGCAWVSVHTNNTVIMTDLSKHFTWAKMGIKDKRRIKNQQMCNYINAMPIEAISPGTAEVT